MALPTSCRRLAYREYTLAPSMPRKTNTVTSMVARTWPNRALAVFGSPPQKFALNTCAFSAKISTTTKVRIGTILA